MINPECSSVQLYNLLSRAGSEHISRCHAGLRWGVCRWKTSSSITDCLTPFNRHGTVLLYLLCCWKYKLAGWTDVYGFNVRRSPTKQLVVVHGSYITRHFLNIHSSPSSWVGIVLCTHPLSSQHYRDVIYFIYLFTYLFIYSSIILHQIATMR